MVKNGIGIFQENMKKNAQINFFFGKFVIG